MDPDKPLKSKELSKSSAKAKKPKTKFNAAAKAIENDVGRTSGKKSEHSESSIYSTAPMSLISEPSKKSKSASKLNKVAKSLSKSQKSAKVKSAKRKASKSLQPHESAPDRSPPLKDDIIHLDQEKGHSAGTTQPPLLYDRLEREDFLPSPSAKSRNSPSTASFPSPPSNLQPESDDDDEIMESSVGPPPTPPPLPVPNSGDPPAFGIRPLMPRPKSRPPSNSSAHSTQNELFQRSYHLHPNNYNQDPVEQSFGQSTTSHEGQGADEEEEIDEESSNLSENLVPEDPKLVYSPSISPSPSSTSFHNNDEEDILAEPVQHVRVPPSNKVLTTTSPKISHLRRSATNFKNPEPVYSKRIPVMAISKTPKSEVEQPCDEQQSTSTQPEDDDEYEIIEILEEVNSSREALEHFKRLTDDDEDDNQNQRTVTQQRNVPRPFQRHGHKHEDHDDECDCDCDTPSAWEDAAEVEKAAWKKRVLPETALRAMAKVRKKNVSLTEREIQAAHRDVGKTVRAGKVVKTVRETPSTSAAPPKQQREKVSKSPKSAARKDVAKKSDEALKRSVEKMVEEMLKKSMIPANAAKEADREDEKKEIDVKQTDKVPAVKPVFKVPETVRLSHDDEQVRGSEPAQAIEKALQPKPKQESEVFHRFKTPELFDRPVTSQGSSAPKGPASGLRPHPIANDLMRVGPSMPRGYPAFPTQPSILKPPRTYGELPTFPDEAQVKPSKSLSTGAVGPQSFEQKDRVINKPMRSSSAFFRSQEQSPQSPNQMQMHPSKPSSEAAGTPLPPTPDEKQVQNADSFPWHPKHSSMKSLNNEKSDEPMRLPQAWKLRGSESRDEQRDVPKDSKPAPQLPMGVAPVDKETKDHDSDELSGPRKKVEWHKAPTKPKPKKPIPSTKKKSQEDTVPEGKSSTKPSKKGSNKAQPGKKSK